MKIISASEFRNHMNRYFDMVNNGEEIIIKSRKHGLFRIEPVSIE
ncbi:type II toxin-antitoxin system Phd/YefM family antitoxin [Bacteroides heparinolyticus]